MNDKEYKELLALWDWFKIPRAATEINKKRLKRLKFLVVMKINQECC